MSRKKTRKGKPKQRPGNQTSLTDARKMENDVEDPQDGYKDQKTSWWSYIRHPSMIIDAITSSIIWIQVVVYQKCAGRMPLFIKSKADDLEQQVKKHITMIDKLNREKTSLSAKYQILSDENTQVHKELQEVNQKNEEDKAFLRNGNLELSNTNSQLRQEFKDIEDENERLRVQTETLTKEKQRLQEYNQGHLNDKTRLENANKDERKKNEQLESENANLSKENNNHQHQNNKLTKLVSDQDENIKSLEATIELQANKIYQAETYLMSLQQEIRQLKTTVDDKDFIIQELYGNMDKLTAEKRILEEEKQDALRRLSEQVSVKLRDNNPNIVDLSDPCRATKLAEMFGELYDNEWTNAYSVLEDNFTEEQAIVVLLDAVMIAYNFCEQRVEEPWKTLEDWFLDKDLPGNQQTSKWLKDSRKVNIQKKVPEIEKIFTKNVQRICGDEKLKALLFADEDLSTYFTKCIEVCLLMVATDPPVVLVCPGWNVIHIEGLLVQHQEEKGDRHICYRDESENSKPSDELSNVSQNTADKKSDLSIENTEVKDISTKLDQEQDLMNDSNSKIEENENIEKDQANCQQEVQGQHESEPQVNDSQDEYTDNSMSFNDLDSRDGKGDSEVLGNSEMLNAKSSNVITDERQQNEDNCTIILESGNLTNKKGIDENGQTVADKMSDHSIENTEVEEITTKLDQEQKLMNVSNSEIKDNENTANIEVNCQQEVQGQYETEQQVSDTPKEYADNIKSFNDLDSRDRKSDSEILGNSERLTTQSNNALPDETQQYENNCTITLESGNLTNEKGIDENKNERDEKNTFSDHERNSPEHKEHYTKIDNSHLFDSDDQSISKQDEQSNQTTDNGIEVEKSEITATADIKGQQLDKELKESREGNGEVLEENVNIEIDKDQSEEKQEVKHTDDPGPYTTHMFINKSEKLLPHASNDNNSVGDTTITSNELSDKSNNSSNGTGGENTIVDNLKFDKDLFKEYTRRGKYLDYVVWPAMRLHENGPLLSKGVAQGSKNENKMNNDNAWTWIHRT